MTRFHIHSAYYLPVCCCGWGLEEPPDAGQVASLAALSPILLHQCLDHLQLIKISTAVIQSQLLLLPPPELIPNVTIILLLRKLVLSFSLVESAGRPRYCLMPSCHPALDAQYYRRRGKYSSLCGLDSSGDSSNVNCGSL
ncbi:hypothetical protein E2C01_005966 [Portunus trituberculatus]|uniref:Uncharacterized protein n=1 Tax=Portunus trituberculatus TaxID=210409 RepID=A0A5B7CWL5_PORTR|nr:hypothetical protein [Portunus trituberculatus]